MPKGSEQLTKEREDEIINACAKLYESMSFKEITIKEIGNITSFKRTAIYNYYNTKEEIFLALLKREYEQWSQELYTAANDKKPFTKNEFAEFLAHSLENRETMLSLLSLNLKDMEDNSHMEKLIDFKKAYGETMNAVMKCLDKLNMSEKEKNDFIYSFFPFMYGIYPYAIVNEKQSKAMIEANINYKYMSIYEIALLGTKKLLGIIEDR